MALNWIYNGGEVMLRKSKTFLVALVLVAQLLSSGYAATGELETGNDSLWDGLPLPASQTRFNLILYSPLFVEAKIVGTIAVYDDTATQRSADYAELYNTAGQLLAIQWFDRFGIERLAVDRGFLEDADQPVGVFVVVLDGEFI